jgi:deazaflavin-dependent oxidoreductase (nitroreductase family)
VDDTIRQALAKGGTIDITTTGRRSGLARRIEINFHNIEGRIYISGSPRPRKRRWLMNLEANPQFTFHLKRGVQADLPAVARPIWEPGERRAVMEKVARVRDRSDVDYMVQYSPLVEVTIEGY